MISSNFSVRREKTSGSNNVVGVIYRNIVVYFFQSNDNFIEDNIASDNLDKGTTHTWESIHVSDDSAAEQHSLLVSTCCSCGHVTWCQRMLMLRPAAAQSRLLSDNVSLSSFQETGLLPCQSLLGDMTFGLSMSRLHLSVGAAGVFGKSHVP